MGIYHVVIVSPNWCTHLEKDFKIFSKSGAVVIPHSFSISKTFKERGCFKNLFCDKIRRWFVDSCQVLHDQLGAENDKN